MDDELVQEIQPLDRGNGRASGPWGRLAFVGWAVALIAVVGVGLAGPSGAPDGASDTTEQGRLGILGNDRADGAPRPTEDPARSPRPISVAILEPALPGTSISTPRLTVRGYFATPVRYIDVRLESRGQHTIELYSYRPEAAPRAGRRVAFGTEFELPALRPNGTMWITVIGFNERGIPVDATRRRIDIGALTTPVERRPGRGVRPTGPTAGYAV